MKPRYKIGMRTVKTVVAVGICLITFQLLALEGEINGIQAALAAVICMKSSLQYTLRTGIDRTIGTVFGSVIGVLFLLANAYLPDFMFSVTGIFGVLLIIYLCNIFKLRASVPISIVVFLIILIAEHDIPPVYYGLARLGETVFGIFIAYMVNRFLDLGYLRKNRLPASLADNAAMDGIRAATADDIGSVMQVWLRANIAAYPHLDEAHWHRIYDDTRMAFKSAAHISVYTQDGIVLGFICFTEDAYILALCVLPQAQRKGIGTSLLNHVKQIMPCLSISVYRHNDTAVKFLRGRGFFPETQKDDEYGMEWSGKNGSAVCTLPEENQ